MDLRNPKHPATNFWLMENCNWKCRDIEVAVAAGAVKTTYWKLAEEFSLEEVFTYVMYVKESFLKKFYQYVTKNFAKLQSIENVGTTYYKYVLLNDCVFLHCTH